MKTSTTKVLARYKSASEPGRVHVVRMDKKTGQITCTCKGYTYRSTCRHRDRQIDLVSERGYRRA